MKRVLAVPGEMWTAFLTSLNQDKFEELATQEPCIRRAYMELQQLSQNKDVRREAEAREKFLMDKIIRENSARILREKKGEKKGEKKELKKELELERKEG
jgi:hypothetical protein